MADAKQILLGTPTNIKAAVVFTNFSLNQTTDQLEVIFQAPAAITITRLGYRYGARTGTPPTYKISLQGVGTDGNPDGAIKGGGSPASKTFTPPADTSFNALWKWNTLDNPYTCARGEYLAWVIAYSSGSVDASNLSSFTAFSQNLTGAANLPFAIQNDAGSRTRQPSGPPVFGYGSSTQAYGTPMQAALTQSITSTTEAGLAFTLPAGWGSTYQVNGVRVFCTLAAGQTLTATLYTATSISDTNILQQVTLDTDAVAAAATVGFVDIYFDETTLTDISYGTPYRLSLSVGSGTNNVSGLTCAVAADCEAWHGGQVFGSTSRAGGNWTDDATSHPFIDLILADITVPSGSGGIIVPANIYGTAGVFGG